MKRATILLLAAAGCAGPVARTTHSAADLELRTLEGAPVRASTFWSKGPVLLVFMTAW